MGSPYPLCSFTGVVTTMNDSEAKAKERKIDVYRLLEIIGVRYRALLYFRYCFSVVCDRFEFLLAYLVSEETNTTPRVSRNCRGVQTSANTPRRVKDVIASSTRYESSDRTNRRDFAFIARATKRFCVVAFITRRVPFSDIKLKRTSGFSAWMQR